MPKLKTLTVYANPYLHLDHEGRLAGACQLDPTHAGGELRHVGASLHEEHTKIVEVFDEGDARGTHNQDTVHAFSAEPMTLPRSPFHIDRVRDGELLLADAGGKPPWLALAKARIAALALWVAHYTEEPDTTFWKEQYALDGPVAEVADALAAKWKTDAEGAETHVTAATKAADDAAKQAEAEAQKAEAEREASRLEVLKSLGAAPSDVGRKPALEHDGGTA